MSRFRPRVVDASLFLLLTIVGLAWLPRAGGYAERAPGIDELGWTAVSFDTWQRLGSVDRADPAVWREGLQKTSYGRISPNLGKLVFGGWLASRGYDLPPPEVFPASHPEARSRFGDAEFRIREGAEHEPFVVGLRRLNRGLLAVVGALLFVTGVLLHGRVLGVLAWLVFLSTPLVREQATLVSTDPLLLGSSLLALVAGALFLEELRRGGQDARGKAVRLVLSGVLLGATVSVKLNGALSGVALGVAAIGLAAIPRAGAGPRGAPVLWALAAGVISLAVFVAIDPVLWPDVPGEIASMLQGWDELISGQQERYFRKALLEPGDRVSAVWRYGALATGPLAASAPGRLVTGLLLLGGFVLLARRAAGSLRDADSPVHAWTIAAWIVVWCVGVTAWIPLRADRYYLPVVLALSPVAALPIAEALGLAIRRSRYRSSR